MDTLLVFVMFSLVLHQGENLHIIRFCKNENRNMFCQFCYCKNQLYMSVSVPIRAILALFCLSERMSLRHIVMIVCHWKPNLTLRAHHAWSVKPVDGDIGRFSLATERWLPKVTPFKALLSRKPWTLEQTVFMVTPPPSFSLLPCVSLQKYISAGLCLLWV